MKAATIVAGAVGLGLIALSACSDLHLNPAASYIQVVIDSPSFRNDLMPVLRQTCGSASHCHGGGNATVDLNLSADSVAYATLVNHPSTNAPIPRVMPFFPDSSFMYLVLLDPASARRNYYRMPLTGYALPFETRETIKNWIKKGALYN